MSPSSLWQNCSVPAHAGETACATLVTQEVAGLGGAGRTIFRLLMWGGQSCRRAGILAGLSSVGPTKGRLPIGRRLPTCPTRKRLSVLFLLLSASLRADTFFVTVAGLGGEPEYEQRFSGWAKDLDKLLHADAPNSKITTLFGPDATRANVEARLREIAKQSKADDSLVLMLIGHGTFDDSEYKFNLPGPDLPAVELASLLDKIPAHQAVILMTSASGASIAALQKAKRVVITATKSGNEKNATVFARYWIEALRDSASDTDKNEVITALEAFRYAEERTAKFYDTQKRLATEHALIEDAGKGEGVKLPSPENGEGLTAGRFAVLRLGAASAQMKDPEKLMLLKRKEDLEASIDELKYRKASMPITEYRAQLQQLLIELAKTQEALDK